MAAWSGDQVDAGGGEANLTSNAEKNVSFFTESAGCQTSSSDELRSRVQIATEQLGKGRLQTANTAAGHPTRRAG